MGDHLLGELAEAFYGVEEGGFPAVGGAGDVDADEGVADVDVVAEVAAEGLSCAADTVAQAEDDCVVFPVHGEDVGLGGRELELGDVEQF